MLSIEVFFHLLRPLMLDGCLWQFIKKGGVGIRALRVLVFRGSREFLYLRGVVFELMIYIFSLFSCIFVLYLFSVIVLVSQTVMVH